MKKLIIFILLAFLVGSANVFANGVGTGNTHKFKTEHQGKKNVKARVKSRKTRSKKSIQKPKSAHKQKPFSKGHKILK